MPNRGETLSISVLIGILEPLDVVAESGIHRDGRRGTPFVLNEQPQIGAVLALVGSAECLLIVDVAAGLEVGERRERVNTLERPRKFDIEPLVDEIAADLQQVTRSLHGIGVRELVEIESARRGREGRCSDVGRAGNVDRGTDQIVGRGLQTAAGDLSSHFVHGGSRRGREPAEGHRLIAVVQARAATHRIQAADISGVGARYVVEAVAQAEPCARSDAVVDASEQVGGVVASGSLPGGRGRPTVSDQIQRLVHGLDDLRSNRDEQGAFETGLFHVGEPERPVARDGSRQAHAVLRLVQRLPRAG